MFLRQKFRAFGFGKKSELQEKKEKRKEIRKMEKTLCIPGCFNLFDAFFI